MGAGERGGGEEGLEGREGRERELVKGGNDGFRAGDVEGMVGKEVVQDQLQ